MARAEVNQPIRGSDAFRAEGDEAAQAQAAILVFVGQQLRGDDGALLARAEAAGLADRVRLRAEEDDAEFPVPRVRATPARFGTERLREQMPPVMAEAAAAPAPVTLPEAEGNEYRAQVAEQLYRDGSPETAAVLLEASLLHPDPLVRLAAASAHLEVSADPRPLLDELVRCTYEDDELTETAAATALARYAPDHPRLRELATPEPPPDTGLPPTRTALLVHGTFAARNRWWQPGRGDFHNHVKGFRPDLYSASDRFGWSGGYAESDRQLATLQLRDWVRGHALEGLDLFAHSHGASIGMLATQGPGIRMGSLVLLSCPVHVNRYFPNFSRVSGCVASVRVKRDIVIALDRGGQRFDDPRIHENVLDIWFDHSASHKPHVWTRHRVRDNLPCAGGPT
jgi:hypothetical protein